MEPMSVRMANHDPHRALVVKMGCSGPVSGTPQGVFRTPPDLDEDAHPSSWPIVAPGIAACVPHGIEFALDTGCPVCFEECAS